MFSFYLILITRGWAAAPRGAVLPGWAVRVQTVRHRRLYCSRNGGSICVAGGSGAALHRAQVFSPTEPCEVCTVVSILLMKNSEVQKD